MKDDYFDFANFRKSYLEINYNYLNNKYLETYKNKYPNFYVSSNAKNSEFNDTFFQYIENEVKSSTNSNYSINNDTGIENKCLFYYNETDQESIRKLSRKYNYDWGIDNFGDYAYYLLSNTPLPSFLKKLIDNSNKEEEIWTLYFDSCIKEYIKRFCMRGNISLTFIKADILFKTGITNEISRFNLKSNEEIEYYAKNIIPFYAHGINDNWNPRSDLKIKYIIKKNQIENVHFIRFYFKEILENLYNKKNREIPPRPIHPIAFNEITNRLIINPLDYLIDQSCFHEYTESLFQSENILRNFFGLPEKGKGWVSETTLFYLIQREFKQYPLIHQARPKWLGRQSLDIYFPTLNIAIEYQGKQHYEPIEYFGGVEAFVKNVERDNKKLKLCRENNCSLIYVEEGYDFGELVDVLKKKIN
jgi:hypothetical protein